MQHISRVTPNSLKPNRQIRQIGANPNAILNRLAERALPKVESPAPCRHGREPVLRRGAGAIKSSSAIGAYGPRLSPAIIICHASSTTGAGDRLKRLLSPFTPPPSAIYSSAVSSPATIKLRPASGSATTFLQGFGVTSINCSLLSTRHRKINFCWFLVDCRKNKNM